MRGARVRMTIGTEHEYSINDAHFTALPVSDQISGLICGSDQSEILFGEVKLGKELQKTVLEFIPRVPVPLRRWRPCSCRGSGSSTTSSPPIPTCSASACIRPDARPEQRSGITTRGRTTRPTTGFSISGSTAGSTSRRSRSTFVRRGKDLLMQYNRIRTLLPYLIALTASSPLVEGHLTGNMDNRSIYYRRNQDVIPQICNGIIPRGSGRSRITGMRRSRSSRRSGRGTQGSSARNGSIQAGSLSGSRGAASRSRRRTNRSASAPIWRSLRW